MSNRYRKALFSRSFASSVSRENKAFRYRFDIAQGIPNEDELDVLRVPRARFIAVLPVPDACPSAAPTACGGDGGLSKDLCSRYGIAYTTQFLGSPRSMRNTQPLLFDGGDAEARERVHACFGELVEAFARAGYLVSRPPTSFQEAIAGRLGLATERSRTRSSGCSTPTASCCWACTSFGTISLTTALTFSVNTVWAEIGETLGGETMQRYMDRLGFGRDLPLDLPDGNMKASGSYVDGRPIPATSERVDVGRMAIGQDKLAVTPLQMAMVSASVGTAGG